ncbi:dTDP-4-amino-4,6-dideoxy-D-glucose ammonia-lyase [Amycolatopsis marina]|uniref:dTDP-4-amino-4,6-dideoxy-D-glucose ammonia-lyase n=1 Tax=Amycolatopsis marina TaxID=490629 RepID=A0A1I0ZKA5_9PSEU|nr:dTDP-4-amino-4,6-dideoxy-D-glucose ammonia-lyase [Amycolatopsis marina]SFB25907.1 dTDP-4-amino-4,6-dideoxy-D-glucose ammonia-lyase [Amycolatopsis marina]
MTEIAIPGPEVASDAGLLNRLTRIFGASPFTTLEAARQELAVDRGTFRRLVDTLARVPELRAAVLGGPAGKYWSKTVLPLERAGVIDNIVQRRAVYPHIVALYPGPTCMFRCHFCVRVTGARYQQDAVDSGNAMFASVIDEMPVDNPHAMYISGGLEPLTNPGLGGLITRAARRGFKMDLYTNSFALTDRTLQRQPGLWDLHRLRTSMYGLDDDEYEQTTGKRAAFGRVKANLVNLQRLRASRENPLRLGFSYIVLPGRAWRLLELADFIAELNEVAPHRPVDFLDIREDYSGRPNGKLPPAERAELQDALGAFNERVSARAPSLHVDYGYALHAVMTGTDAELIRLRPESMRPSAHIQAGVQIDLLGDVYLYREAGFPGLTGAHRYIAGRVEPGTALSDVVRSHLANGRTIDPLDGDEYFLDGFDQVVTARLNQVEADIAAGWGDVRGLLR